MNALDIIDIYIKAKEALSLPGLHKEDRRNIAQEFLRYLPTAHVRCPYTVRAVRSAILKEAEREVHGTQTNATGEAPKAAPKRKARKPRTEA